MNRISLLLSFMIIPLGTIAQVEVPFLGKITYLKGFKKEIKGENINYFSALPDIAKVALLTRCTDGKKAIEWETEAVPNDFKGKNVYFAWLAAYARGTNHGDMAFDLFIGDQSVLTFHTSKTLTDKAWTAHGKQGTQLVFEWKTDDGASDAHGYMYLKVPVEMVEKGKPVRLKVVGHNENSPDWYMTFKYEFAESIQVSPVPFLTRNNQQPLSILVTHFGSESSLKMEVDDKEKITLLLKPGLNTFEIYRDAIQTVTPVKIKASITNQLEKTFIVELKPVIYREIHFIHHAHYDVGYSHLQTEVEKIHNKNIADALRYIDQTSHLPREAQFKWNVETSMAIDNFLKVCTEEQKEKLIKALKNGNIGVGALYANISTGLCQPEELFNLTCYASQLEKEYGVSIPAAMISDIPGLTWGTIPALARSGVRYFSDGPNYVASLPDEGDRVGHSNKNWSDKPFWWVSPSGNEKILFWMAGRGYSSWHGFKPGDIRERGKKKIAEYMDELDRTAYPYEMVQWRYNIVADNGITDSLISQYVYDWNNTYRSPKIILNTVDAMFREFEKMYGDQLPTYAGDFSPYWEDGAYSTAAEMTMNRRNSEKLTQLSTLYAINKSVPYPAESIEQAWKKILLWDEHTWGAYNSISDPDIPFVINQWKFKQKYLLDGDSIIQHLDRGFNAGNILNNKIDVFNTLSFSRTEVVYVDNKLAGNGNIVIDEKGKKVLSQKLSDGRLAFLAENIPPMGSRKYQIVAGKQDTSQPGVSATNKSLENEYIRLEMDEANGCIKSLVWKPLNSELTSANKLNGLNQFFYVPGRDPSLAKTNQASKLSLAENGPLLAVIKVESNAPGCHSLVRFITVYKGINRVDIANTIDKIATREKESIHFAFPFNIPGAISRYNTGWGGIFQSGAYQLAGSNQDYYCVQHWCDVSNQQIGVALLLSDACLVEPGEMINEKLNNFGVKEWKTVPNTTPTFYSYVMNNYWHTNFKADQEGLATFHYSLAPHGLFNVAEVDRQGLAFNQPLIVKQSDGHPDNSSFFTVTNPNILVTSVQKKDQGYLTRLYNASGAPQEFKINPGRRNPGKMMIKTGDKGFRETELSNDLRVPAYGIMEVLF